MFLNSVRFALNVLLSKSFWLVFNNSHPPRSGIERAPQNWSAVGAPGTFPSCNSFLCFSSKPILIVLFFLCFVTLSSEKHLLVMYFYSQNTSHVHLVSLLSLPLPVYKSFKQLKTKLFFTTLVHIHTHSL